jgi:hypothetical protein
MERLEAVSNPPRPSRDCNGDEPSWYLVYVAGRVGVDR